MFEALPTSGRLFAACRADAISLFQSLSGLHATDPVYAVALCADNDLTSVFPAAQSEAAMAASVQRSHQDHARRMAAIEAMSSRPGAPPLPAALLARPDPDAMALDCRWFPGDWTLRLDPAVNFQATNAVLAAAHRAGESPQALALRRQTTLDCLCAALAAARDHAWPGVALAVFACIMDADASARQAMRDAARPHNPFADWASLERWLR